jgi:F0F1-type ATP synthase membrane subunit b/b'
MKRNLKILYGLLAPTLMLTFATLAHAQEATNQQGGTNTFKWIHFVVVAAAFYWVFWKLLPPKFHAKADSISSAIAKATAAKAEAERQLAEATAKLASLEHEVAQFRAQAQKDVAAELERLRGMIKVDADKIGVAARAEIEAAERAARVELKVLAAKLAMDRAESLVSKEMTPALQQSMLNQFVQSLQGRPN